MASEIWDVTVQRQKTPDHELLTSTDTITYRVSARNPAEARKKAAKQVESKHRNWGGHWHFADQERVK